MPGASEPGDASVNKNRAGLGVPNNLEIVQLDLDGPTATAQMPCPRLPLL